MKTCKFLPEICELLLFDLFFVCLIKFTGHKLLLFHHMLYEELSESQTKFTLGEENVKKDTL